MKRRFEEAHADTVGKPGYERVWTMLLDTNLRLQEAEELRSYLHRFRRVYGARRAELGQALEAYRHVRRYVEESDVVMDYRRNAERPSSLGIEIRKDLVCTFDPETGVPHEPGPEQIETARKIASAIAGAVATYIDTDRPVYARAAQEG